MFGSRYPTRAELNRHLPTAFVGDGQPFTAARLRITPLMMGASELPAAVVYLLPERRSAIVGDLVNVLTVAAPTISLARWLEQLGRIDRAARPGTILHVMVRAGRQGRSSPSNALICCCSSASSRTLGRMAAA